jgi:hypothetical protein
MKKVIYVNKAQCGELSGYIESDQFTDVELKSLGYNFNDNGAGSVFHVPFNGSFEVTCNNDHEVYLDGNPIDIVCSNPMTGQTLSLVEDVDFSMIDLEQTIIDGFGEALWTDWHTGLIDWTYDNMRGN